MFRKLMLTGSLLYGLAASGHASTYPTGYCEALPAPVAPNHHVVDCLKGEGKKLCLGIPAGACQHDNTVTVTVDGTVAYQHTYKGSGDPRICSQQPGSMIAHVFPAGTHQVNIQSSHVYPGHPTGSAYTVTVNSCLAWLTPLTFFINQ